MALTDIEIGRDELKLVMLLVPCDQKHPLDSFILDELLVSKRFITLRRCGHGPGTRVAAAKLKF
jgi:hypothetical protein